MFVGEIVGAVGAILGLVDGAFVGDVVGEVVVGLVDGAFVGDVVGECVQIIPVHPGG